MERTSATAAAAYLNNTSVGGITDASALPPAFSLFIGANNNGGVAAQFSPHQIAVTYVGAALSAGEQTAAYNAFQTYLQAVGAV